MPDKHTNGGVSTVVTAPSPATTGTSLGVQTGDGAHFPAPPFDAVVFPANSPPTPANMEFVRVTAGPPGSDTGWTIKRQQQGTGARAIQPGDQIVSGFSAKSFTDIENVLGQSAYHGAVLSEPSLVAFWRLGERRGPVPFDAATVPAYDQLSANHGTYQGGVAFEQPGALVNDHDPAVLFDGVSGCVIVPDAPALRLTGDLTLEGWAGPSTTNSLAVVAKENSGFAAPYQLLVVAGVPTLYVGDGASHTSVAAASAIPLNTFSFIAAVVSGTTVTHYLNGQPNGTGSIAGQARVDGGSQLGLGAQVGVGSFADAFAGPLDEIAIYNAALSAARIAAHYNAGRPTWNRGVSVTTSATTSIPSSTTTVIPFNQEQWKDETGMHSNSTNSSRLTCVTPGRYLIQGVINYVQAAAGNRYATIVLNGATVLAGNARPPITSTNSDDELQVSRIYRLNAGDYVELGAFQSSGSALNVQAANTYFAMERISG